MVEFLLISILFFFILIVVRVPKFIQGCAEVAIKLIGGCAQVAIGMLIIVGIVLLAIVGVTLLVMEETRSFVVGVLVLGALVWFISWSADKHER